MFKKQSTDLYTNLSHIFMLNITISDQDFFSTNGNWLRAKTNPYTPKILDLHMHKIWNESGSAKSYLKTTSLKSGTSAEDSFVFSCQKGTNGAQKR